MKRLYFTFFILTCATPAFAGPAGWDWFSYNGHEYALTNILNDWIAAESEAVSAGGHLVTIDDLAENEFLANTFDDFQTSNYDIAWIGLEGKTTSASWVSGDPLTYTNYALTPNYDTGTHFYMHLYHDEYDSYGQWNNNVLHDTSDTQYSALGIIELDPPMHAPAPSAILLCSFGIAVASRLRKKRSL